jgi:hypothetical protein
MNRVTSIQKKVPSIMDGTFFVWIDYQKERVMITKKNEKY